ncbi:MAG: hypothetical protein ACO1OB_15245 [Archangium sp.]
MSDSHAHWNDVYARKRTDEVSWFTPHLEVLRYSADQLHGEFGAQFQFVYCLCRAPEH